MSIKDDATTVLLRLARLQEMAPNLRHEYVQGRELDNLLGFGPERLSDAVALLEENGYADVIKTFGTAPYDFNAVLLTSRGRFESERLIDQAKTVEPSSTSISPAADDRSFGTITRLAQPVG